MNRIKATALVPGRAAGQLAVLSAPLSLWGGFSIETGAIIDASHPQQGLCLTGRIVAMRAARGSSSASGALVEAVRAGTGPAAIILSRPDPILVMGALVAQDLYGRDVPILVVADEDWPKLIDATDVTIDGLDGTICTNTG